MVKRKFFFSDYLRDETILAFRARIHYDFIEKGLKVSNELIFTILEMGIFDEVFDGEKHKTP